MDNEKISWQGIIISIQPRTRVWRYLTDNRTHYHLGYNLFITDTTGEKTRNFVVAISEIQFFKHNFQIGDTVMGDAWTKKYPEREFANYYKASKLKVIKRNSEQVINKTPPWIIPCPTLKIYEKRGARMLNKNLWKGKCFQCVWANMANVEIMWDFDKNKKKYRFETFCYGPLSCKWYKKGPSRQVPYKGRSSLDNGTLDEIMIQYRCYEEDDEYDY